MSDPVYGQWIISYLNFIAFLHFRSVAGVIFVIKLLKTMEVKSLSFVYPADLHSQDFFWQFLLAVDGVIYFFLLVSVGW